MPWAHIFEHYFRSVLMLINLVVKPHLTEGSEGHPAADDDDDDGDDDDLVIRKRASARKRALFPTITGGGSCPPPQCAK